MPSSSKFDVSRRDVLIGGAAAAAVTSMANAVKAQGVGANGQVSAPEIPSLAKVSFTVNGTVHGLELDTRTTLLDALREHLHLTGSKKGCDQGQCRRVHRDRRRVRDYPITLDKVLAKLPAIA